MNTAVRSAFQRIGTEYRPVPAPAGPGQPYPPYAPVRTFSASRALDKLIALCIVAVVSAAFGYAVVPRGVAFACMVLAFGVVLVSWFRMGWARVLAPAYSLLQGVALGSVSAAYASVAHGIVPLAIVFTAAVFVGALVLYRTGLVRVTPRMMSLAFMGALGIVAIGVLSLIGLSLPGVNSFGTAGLVFGLFAMAVAVLNLFADFEYMTRAEAAGISAEAEWAAAFAIMTALVLVYISMLRILASAYGGGGRR
ncbi:MAG: Bax inhibitor-1/YccA family protein, partial [Acidimicrobiaceae bacterium]|nr:Bax inhibitor-1/YccA family protein [Acidimicrobiaceae bacterium]